MLPATPWGVWEIIKRTGRNLALSLCVSRGRHLRAQQNLIVCVCVFCMAGIPTLGKNVVVAGRSKNVGMPIAMLLHTDGRHERPGGKLSL